MKHCPQCDFIYEDDQNVCDMDGKELVSDSATVVNEPSFAMPPLPDPETDAAPSQSPARRWRNFALVTVVGFVIAALVVAVYLARTHQLRSRESSEPATDRSAGRSSAQSTSGDSGRQSSADLSSQTSSADTASPEQSHEQAAEFSSAQADQPVLSSSSSQSSASGWI